MYQFSIKDFNEFLNNKIPPENTTPPTIYPSAIIQKINNYKKQDIEAKRCINNYINANQVGALLSKYNYRCIYCHVAFNYMSWTLDRIDNNIAHTYTNCVVACFKCNSDRKDTLFNKYFRKTALIRYDKLNPMIHIINNENKIVFEKF